jgi:Xylose isomerase-like TIM barrel
VSGPGALRAGVCSVTLRSAGVAQTLAAAAGAGLAAIEWGGDIHVPPGDTRWAAQVGAATRAAGLAVASYGSYHRFGAGEEFGPVLAAATALGAPRIRVWAGRTGSAQTTAAERDRLVRAVREAADRAAGAGIGLAFEFHAGTLTDTAASARALVEEVAHAAVRCYWQPPVGAPADAAVAGLDLLLDLVVAVHAFSWWPGKQRLPLTARADLWRAVLARLAGRARPTDVLLEFVAGDSAAALRRDGRALLGLVRAAGG